MRVREPHLRAQLHLRRLRVQACGEGCGIQGRRRPAARHVRRVASLSSYPRPDSPRTAHPRTHGPLIHSRAAEKVQRHVDDALARGAQLVHGGKRLPELGSDAFFAPTILADVPADALVCQEETFGPLAALTRFETEEEVVRLANDTPVGLAGYFYSRDIGRVWRVAEALEVGMVGVNTPSISQVCVPFGGVKESGLGKCCCAVLLFSLGS